LQYGATAFCEASTPALLRCRRIDFEIPEEFSGGDMGCLGGPLAFRTGLLRPPGTFAIALEAQPFQHVSDLAKLLPHLREPPYLA
jgi:hypothetical protein